MYPIWCICIYIYVYTLFGVYVCTLFGVYVYIYICIYPIWCICMCIPYLVRGGSLIAEGATLRVPPSLASAIYIHIYIYIYNMYIDICMYMYVHVCVHVFVDECVWKDRICWYGRIVYGGEGGENTAALSSLKAPPSGYRHLLLPPYSIYCIYMRHILYTVDICAIHCILYKNVCIRISMFI